MTNRILAAAVAAFAGGVAVWSAEPAGAAATALQQLDFENVPTGTVSLVYTRNLAGPIPVWAYDQVKQVPTYVTTVKGNNVLAIQSNDVCRRVHVGIGTACGSGIARLFSFRIAGTTAPAQVYLFDGGGNVGPTADGLTVPATGAGGSQVVTFATGSTGLARDAVSQVAVVFRNTGGVVDDFQFESIACGCGEPPPPPPPPAEDCDDWFTGGGWIDGTPSGAKGTFGVGGGLKKQGLWGHLNYIDHGTGMHVHWNTITGYETLAATRRRSTGTCTINGVSGFTYVLEVEDNGEPGRGDVFSLALSNGYTASGLLNGGGNIQLHKANCTGSKGGKPARKYRQPRRR